MTKEEQDDRRAARMVNLILQRSAMRPGEIVEVIVPDDEEEDYVEDPYFMHEDGTPDLEKILSNSDFNPIEYIYTRDATGRVVHADSRYKQGRGKGEKVLTEKADKTNEPRITHTLPMTLTNLIVKYSASNTVLEEATTFLAYYRIVFILNYFIPYLHVH